jgi:hypothetical protein
MRGSSNASLPESSRERFLRPSGKPGDAAIDAIVVLSFLGGRGWKLAFFWAARSERRLKRRLATGSVRRTTIGREKRRRKATRRAAARSLPSTVFALPTYSLGALWFSVFVPAPCVKWPI